MIYKVFFIRKTFIQKRFEKLPVKTVKGEISQITLGTLPAAAVIPVQRKFTCARIPSTARPAGSFLFITYLDSFPFHLYLAATLPVTDSVPLRYLYVN